MMPILILSHTFQRLPQVSKSSLVKRQKSQKKNNLFDIFPIRRLSNNHYHLSDHVLS